MAELKFACPHCQQHISADTGYSGMQINCPSCQGPLVVPGAPPAPVAVSSAPPPPPPPSSPAPSMALHRPAPAPAATSSSTCPSCNGALPRGAMLCTNCGYNLQTKQRMVAGRAVAMGKPRDPHADDTPWYKTPWPYVGGVMVLLGILYFLGQGNPPVMLAFLGVVALYTFVVGILVLVAAFKESVATGFLTMCLPFYIYYFVFKVSENTNLKVLFGTSMVLWISVRFAFAK